MRGLEVQLKESEASGNATDPACGVTDECADLASEFIPRVKAGVCATSRNTELGGSWGVCPGE